MKKFLVIFGGLAVVAMVLAAAFGIGHYLGSREDEKEEVVVAEEPVDDAGFELPQEVERRIVTAEEVESKLVEIGELSTYSGEYTCTIEQEESRYWFDKIPVLGSTNTIVISCSGIVKVGYDVSDIGVRVSEDTIFISIPEAQLNDNYVIWDSVVCSESNNILNPIEFSQYQELIDEIEAKGLEDVTSKGIYRKAEKNLKVLIEAFLGEFTDYRIEYL